MLLESLARQGDPEAQAELDAAKQTPAHGAHVWSYFLDIAATRQSNGMALTRLSRIEIAQWAADELIVLEPWERRTILDIDALFVAVNTPDPSKSKEA